MSFIYVINAANVWTEIGACNGFQTADSLVQVV